MGNLGVHGESVLREDAARALDDLCEVLDWYLQRYGVEQHGGVAAAGGTSAPTVAPPVDSATEPAGRIPESPKTRPVISVGAPREIINSIGMKFVLIPAGEFLMGSPDTDKDAFDNEKPQHRVQITRPFYLGATEVTQGQYRAATGKTPSHFQGSDDLPVEQVSWNDAIAFCDKLNELEKGSLEGACYRLPTEVEWEYACRAGSTTRYSFGDDPVRLSDHAWFRANSAGKTHPVGQKQPNAWGLNDMYGNVWEWCCDAYEARYDQQSPGADPLCSSEAGSRVYRGGSWVGSPRLCRSAFRRGETPGIRYFGVGFRVARSLPRP
jgi:formylglycine-generating enzyme required for sulfatase activity